jgi:hypothetical protein
MSFYTEKEDTLIKLFVRGKIINLKTNEPLKRISINAYHEKYEDSLPDHFIDIIAPYLSKTNSKGEFIIEILFNRNYPEFWLYNSTPYETRRFSEIQILFPSIEAVRATDTLDLGNIYFCTL